MKRWHMKMSKGHEKRNTEWLHLDLEIRIRLEGNKNQKEGLLLLFLSFSNTLVMELYMSNWTFIMWLYISVCCGFLNVETKSYNIHIISISFSIIPSHFPVFNNQSLWVLSHQVMCRCASVHMNTPSTILLHCYQLHY
jgi:hypothetical protein